MLLGGEGRRGHAVQGCGGDEQREQVKGCGDCRLGDLPFGKKCPYLAGDLLGAGPGGNPGERDLGEAAVAAGGLDLAAIRPIRDDIRQRVRDLLGDLGIPA